MELIPEQEMVIDPEEALEEAPAEDPEEDPAEEVPEADPGSPEDSPRRPEGDPRSCRGSLYQVKADLQGEPHPCSLPKPGIRSLMTGVPRRPKRLQPGRYASRVKGLKAAVIKNLRKFLRVAHEEDPQAALDFIRELKCFYV